MEASGVLSIALALGVGGLLLLWGRRRGGNLPPGPTPLPFLGNVLQVEVTQLIASLRKLGETYGEIFTFHLGSRPCVVLSGYRLLKEALIDHAEEFSGRGDFAAVQQWSRGNGIVYGNGERWRQLRRFAIVTLKSFGMGKRGAEERVREEAQHLIQQLYQTHGQPFDPTFLLSCAGSNIICWLVFGERFEYGDERFLTLMGLINANWKLMSSTWGQLLFIFPKIMRFVPGPHRQIYANYLRLAEFVGERVRRHRQTLDPQNPRDFIDCFLLKMQQEKGNPDTHFTEDTLSKTTVNLFFAGTETVSSTLRYGLRILLRYPEVEARLHEEIDRVIGRHRSPCMEDRSRMPYVDAVIHEIQRFADIVPMGVPHTTTRDVQLRGYTIPKGMNVIPLLCTSQFDPSQFANPEAFDPGHFLDENGRFKRNDAFMAFSAGKRMCFGEGLAVMELFIFLTSILQHFQLKAEEDRATIDITPESSGLGNIPRLYRLSLIPR
ncbi:cytochrome P450 2F3-like [Buteo buteo]|uniref:cytochrome P450 2F3-like n=1 Tax=Buteo buteo TaxID=30397 RepID=UPI003EBF88AA